MTDKKIYLKSSPPDKSILSRLDIIDQHTEEIIQEIAALCGVEFGDPVYMLLAKSIADRIAIEGTRQDLAQLCHTIEVRLNTLQNLTESKVQTIHDLTTDIKTEANRLSRQLARQKQSSSPLSTLLLPFFGAVVGSVTVVVLLQMLSS